MKCKHRVGHVCDNMLAVKIKSYATRGVRGIWNVRLSKKMPQK